jgi:hypothetical protein
MALRTAAAAAIEAAGRASSAAGRWRTPQAPLRRPVSCNAVLDSAESKRRDAAPPVLFLSWVSAVPTMEGDLAGLNFPSSATRTSQERGRGRREDSGLLAEKF